MVEKISKIFDPKFLKSDTVELLKETIWFLSNLAGGDSEATDFVCVKGNFISKIFKFLEKCQNPELLVEIFFGLSNISGDSPY